MIDASVRVYEIRWIFIGKSYEMNTELHVCSAVTLQGDIFYYYSLYKKRGGNYSWNSVTCFSDYVYGTYVSVTSTF